MREKTDIDILIQTAYTTDVCHLLRDNNYVITKEYSDNAIHALKDEEDVIRKTFTDSVMKTGYLESILILRLQK